MWLWIVATLVAYYIKGLCGFANTLVFTSILGFGANNIDISPVDLLISYPSNIIMAVKNRKNLDRKVYLPLVVLVLAGSLPGAFLLKNVNAQYIKVAFGIVVVLIGIEMFFREKNGIKGKGSKLMLGSIGLLSGLLCGMFGIGALLAAYVGRVTNSSDDFKANINAVFVAENTFRVILYLAIGVIDLAAFKQALLIAPFMLLGMFAGMKSCQFLDDKVVKKLVILFLILSGVMLVIKNL